MKWIAISGSWRRTDQEIENNVRNTVKDIIMRGDGIVSGGALGVDYIATDEAVRQNPKADRIKIFLPATLARYAAHMKRRAKEGVITVLQAESLIFQLKELKKINKKAVVEKKGTAPIDKTLYYQRNSDIVNYSDELVAFRVRTKMSEGLGTQDTIEKANQKGIPVRVHLYDLTGQP
jgi:hypothetical protein